MATRKNRKSRNHKQKIIKGGCFGFLFTRKSSRKTSRKSSNNDYRISKLHQQNKEQFKKTLKSLRHSQSQLKEDINILQTDNFKKQTSHLPVEVMNRNETKIKNKLKKITEKVEEANKKLKEEIEKEREHIKKIHHRVE